MRIAREKPIQARYFLNGSMSFAIKTSIINVKKERAKSIVKTGIEATRKFVIAFDDIKIAERRKLVIAKTQSFPGSFIVLREA